MFFMSGRSRLGLAGIGACVLGLVMTIGAAVVYSHPTGSNIDFDRDLLFAVVFFAGEFIGLLGLGVLILHGIYGRQRGGREDQPNLGSYGGCSQPEHQTLYHLAKLACPTTRASCGLLAPVRLFKTVVLRGLAQWP